MKNSMQSLPSSNNDTTNSNIYPLKTDEEISQMEKQHTVLSAQQLQPKMGVKAFNQTTSNKVC
jgi:hypothetical protein